MILRLVIGVLQSVTFIYPLFADMSMGMNLHVASQYYKWPKATYGTVMPRVDKNDVIVQ